jgi:hypothetical protein
MKANTTATATAARMSIGPSATIPIEIPRRICIRRNACSRSLLDVVLIRQRECSVGYKVSEESDATVRSKLAGKWQGAEPIRSNTTDYLINR